MAVMLGSGGLFVNCCFDRFSAETIRGADDHHDAGYSLGNDDQGIETKEGPDTQDSIIGVSQVPGPCIAS